MGDLPSSHVFNILAGLVISGAVIIIFNLARAGLESYSSGDDEMEPFLVTNKEVSITAIQIFCSFSTLIYYFCGLQLVDLVASRGWLFSLIGICILVLYQAVFLSLLPRTIGIHKPNQVVTILDIPLSGLVKVMSPVAYPLQALLRKIVELFGLKSVDLFEEGAQTIEQLSQMVSRSKESGMIDKDEEDMVRGVFELSETIVREVMTPRLQVAAIKINSSLDEILKVIRESGKSRFPIYGEELDDIKGILIARDILNALPEILAKKTVFSLNNFTSEALYIPATKPVDELLAEFKKQKQHLAIVLDEHGAIDGVVTIEDLIEQIVGDIYDESESSKPNLAFNANGEIELDGGVLVTDINAKLDLKIQIGDYDTIAGFILREIGKIPQEGDIVEVINTEKMKILITVLEVESRRIARVKLSIKTEPETLEELSKVSNS